MKQQQASHCKTDANECRPPQLSLLVNMDQPHQVFQEVQAIAFMLNPDSDLRALKTLFADILNLFGGKYPDYQACNTAYHNLKHTTDTTLAMTRLMHGAHLSGFQLGRRDTLLGIMAALFHDTGYIQEKTDSAGTGAKLSAVHISRGIHFMTQYLQLKGYSGTNIQRIKTAIQCTDLERPVDSIQFESEQYERIGKMLAAADLLAQTADRTYLEKLPLLLGELKEAGVKDFQNEIEFFKASLQFNQKMAQRLDNDLNGVNRFLMKHFSVRWRLNADMYQDSINNSMHYLASFINRDGDKYPAYLRRKIGR